MPKICAILKHHDGPSGRECNAEKGMIVVAFPYLSPKFRQLERCAKNLDNLGPHSGNDLKSLEQHRIMHPIDLWFIESLLDLP